MTRVFVWSCLLSACSWPAVPGGGGETETGPGLDDSDSVGIDTASTGDSGDSGDSTAETAVDSPPDTGVEDSSSTVGTIPDSGGDTSPWVDTEPAVPRTAPIVVYAVRHCEKEDEGDDPGLTEEGQARAEALAERMAAEPLAAIYATDLVRTQETVQPTADDHGLPVVTDIDPEDDLAAYILNHHDDQTVLHAGHSYTLPDFMEAIGVTDDIDIDGYGQLWMITIDVDGTATVEETTFGE